MNFTLNQLQIFLKIVETNSITKASEILNLTQPAVSIQLKKFQEQFEIPLTEVVGRKIHITDFGKEIAIAAENIINQVHSINHKTSHFQGRLSGKLRISVVSTGKYVMPYYLSDFMEKNKDVELQMDVTNKSTVTEQLMDNTIDFALVSTLPSKLNVEKLDLLPNRLYLVGSTKSSFKKNIHNNDQFIDIPMIFRENGSGTRQAMEVFFKKKNIPVSKKIELTSNEAVKQAVLAGLGYSIMPIIGIKNELKNNELQIIPVKGLPIITNWSLIWIKGKKHSPVTAAFIDYIKKNKAEIFSSCFSWHEQV